MPAAIRKTTFDLFFEEREALIFKFNKGDISKKEYIEEHYYFIKRLNLKPFSRIDSFEKGIYNCQYYNAVAKYNRLRANDRKLAEKHPELMKEINDDVKKAYREKDMSIRRLLRFLEYKNMEAYYIKAKSEYLDNKLFEIVLYDHDGLVFHSTSRGLREELEREEVFSDVRKKSRIDEYVNKKY
jgi:hypothetical protein